MRNIKTGLTLILTSLYLLAISAFLTLAIDQAILLTRLYRVSTSPGPAADFGSLDPGFGSDLLILAVVAAILFLLVRGQLHRLWPATIVALLLFVTLNLYSGRHLLPQLFIWPTPPSLATQYSQALAANDLDAVLRLTGRSEACETKVAQAFQEHEAQLGRSQTNNQEEVRIQDIAVKSITTFYEKPVPQRFALMQPVPSQVVTAMAEIENGQTIWLNLKMRYTPFWGTRYICGQEIDD